MQMSEALWSLIQQCVAADVSFELTYETGRFIPGEFVGRDDAAEHVQQGPAGFTINVAGLSPADPKTGGTRLYPVTIEGMTACLNAGFQALRDH